MTREVLKLRLHRPCGSAVVVREEATVPTLVPALLRQLREGDRDARWRFRFCLDGSGGVEVWLHGLPSVIDRLEQAVRLTQVPEGRIDVLSRHRIEDQDPVPAIELNELLSAMSSDLALALSTRATPEESDGVRLAALNLRLVCELLPSEDRGGFLFLLWLLGSDGATAGERLLMATRADEAASTILGLSDPDTLDKDDRGDWCAYAQKLRFLVDEYRHRPGVLINYALFDHARLTHHRLGLSQTVEAVAARALRPAMARMPEVVPVSWAVPAEHLVTEGVG
ncbi:hypothetical protein [Micromonospora sp. DT31]|uniref:hypothetical protein n=1 Tax=Micromonospora sp. DT31 TaxID=3393434 RepID=UPI003CED5525